MSDDDVVIVCGLGHLSEVGLELELSPLDIDLVVFAVKFDRKGPKKEGRKQETDGHARLACKEAVCSFFHLS